MTIIRPSSVRVFFDNPLARDTCPSAEPAAGFDTEVFMADAEMSRDTLAKMYPHRLEGTVSFDLEASKQFDDWAGIVKREAAMAALRELTTTRTAGPFEFYPPTFYHGDMMRNASDRRFWPCPGSATGKSEHSLGLYGARLMRASNVGKTESLVIKEHLLREMSNYSFGKLGCKEPWRTTWQPPDLLPKKRYIPFIVALLCKNWEENK